MLSTGRWLQADIALASVERVVVTVGPAPSPASASALPLPAVSRFLNIPAIGVTTLEVMAAAAREMNPGKSVLAAIDAKREEIYLQSFDVDGQPLDEARAVTIDEARAISDAFDGVVTGSARRQAQGRAAGGSA